SRVTEVGWFAKPARKRAAYSQLPLSSPVKMRPVRLPPCAAGARPTTRSRAAGSPNPGTGRPQYVQARKRATFSRATRSRCATSRGHSRQRTMRRSAAASLLAAEDTGREEEPVRVAHGASERGALARRLDPAHRDGLVDLRRRRVRRTVAGRIVVGGVEQVSRPQLLGGHRRAVGP